MANDNLQSIEQLMGSHDSQRSRLAETQKLVSKWEPTGLLKVLKKRMKFTVCLFFLKTKHVS